MEPEKRRRTGNKGSFKPGQSGNPGGRPRRTDEEREVLYEICKLAENVPGKLKGLLENAKTPPAIQLRICELILDRAYGKPESNIKVIRPKADMLEDIRAEMERIRAETDNNTRERS